MGPTSERLAANLGEARSENELTTAALAARLKQLGQPIHETAITKIEKLDRRVDAARARQPWPIRQPPADAD